MLCYVMLCYDMLLNANNFWPSFTCHVTISRFRNVNISSKPISDSRKNIFLKTHMNENINFSPEGTLRWERDREWQWGAGWFCQSSSSAWSGCWCWTPYSSSSPRRISSNILSRGVLIWRISSDVEEINS